MTMEMQSIHVENKVDEEKETEKVTDEKMKEILNMPSADVDIDKLNDKQFQLLRMKSLKKTRMRWTSRRAFLLALIGGAIGLGNVWRFPYLCYTYGGGAFLLPYLIALVIIGLPMMLLELSIGVRIQKGTVDCFGWIADKWKGVGLLHIFVSWLVVLWYSVLVAWALWFFFVSFSPELPFADGKAETYFYNSSLARPESISGLSDFNWKMGGMYLIVWILAFIAVHKGVRSIGWMSYITVPLPILLMIILLIRGVTLPGSMLGIKYYLYPDFNKLLSEPIIWAQATGQIFFSLCVAGGYLMPFGSYMDRKEKILTDAFLVAIINCTFSFLSGFAVFGCLGYIATKNGVGIADVVEKGPGLAFVVFPTLLSSMDIPNLWSLLFFGMLFLLGFGSVVCTVEGVGSSINDWLKGQDPKAFSFVQLFAHPFTVRNQEKLDLLKVRREMWKVRHHMNLWVCIFSFLFGLIYVTDAGEHFLSISNHYTGLLFLVGGWLEAILFGWFKSRDQKVENAGKTQPVLDFVGKLKRFFTEETGAEDHCKKMTEMSGQKFHIKFWSILWKYFAVILVGIVGIVFFVQEFINPGPAGDFPLWSIIMGWTIIIGSLSIVLFFYFVMGAKYASVDKLMLTEQKSIIPDEDQKKVGFTEDVAIIN